MARLRNEDLLPSEYERRLARTAAAAPTSGRGVGSTIGTIAGGALGALGFLGGPLVGAATLGAGASAGGAIGNYLGGEVGDAVATDAENKGLRYSDARAKKLSVEDMRRRALQALVSRDSGL